MEVAETVLNQQEPKLGEGVDAQRQNNHLMKIIGIVLSLVMIALTVYVLNLQHQNFNILSKSTDIALNAGQRATVNYMTYVGKYKETKIELDETTRKLIVVNNQLNQVTADLASTKGMLVQTQGMLSQAQDENAKLKQELLGLDNLQNTESVQNMGELQAKIAALRERDSQVSVQLSELKSQLRVYQADFSDPQEGRSLIILFQNKIRMVKNRMHYLKQQAYFARVAAQKEKDRLAALNGNSGFMLRNGQLQNPNGTNKSFAIDVKIVQ